MKIFKNKISLLCVSFFTALILLTGAHASLDPVLGSKCPENTEQMYTSLKGDFFCFDEGDLNILGSDVMKWDEILDCPWKKKMLAAKPGESIADFMGHRNYVNSAAFSPDGKQIVTGSDDGTAKIWNSSTGKVIESLSGHYGVVRIAIFSPDSKWIVIGALGQHTVKIWKAP